MEISVKEASAVLREATRESIRLRSLWYLIQGLLLVVLGVAALMSPFLAASVTMFFLGWLLVIAGFAQAIGLISASEVHYFWFQLISAVLAVLVGWIFLTRPEAGLLAASLLMVVYFMVDGIQRVIFSLMVRPLRNWGWMLASGVMGIALSLILAMNLPGAAGWLIGVLLGIEMIGIGGAMAFVAWDIRRATA